MKIYRKSLLCLLILVLVPTMMPMSSFADKVYADAIWYNGKIVTLDKASHVYQAIAVKDGKIVAVGSVNSIKAYVNQTTKQYDLKGKTVIPGMIDTHLHFMRYGLTFLQIGCTDKSKEWILDQVKKMADETDDTLWVRGSGWNQMIWSNPVFPTAADLDAVSGGNPVILTRSDNHTLWVNSKAMELAGITKDTPDPAGGSIGRDAAGNPTGILVDTAMNLVNSVVPDWSKQEVEKAYIIADQMYSKVGLTTVHDAGDKVDLDILKKLISEGKIKTRVYEVLDKTTVTPRLERGEKPEIGLYNNHLTIRAMKLKSDGALGSRGAYMLSDYSDAPGVTGNCLIPKEELKEYCRKALELGYQVDIHAIGDKCLYFPIGLFFRPGSDKTVYGALCKDTSSFNIVSN
jgi:predicted amidohydrolase YtcJ